MFFHSDQQCNVIELMYMLQMSNSLGCVLAHTLDAITVRNDVSTWSFSEAIRVSYPTCRVTR